MDYERQLEGLNSQNKLLSEQNRRYAEELMGINERNIERVQQKIDFKEFN